MSGAELIAAERQRQMDVEGWTPTHDDDHERGELLIASKAYIEAALNVNDQHGVGYELPPYDWPWDVTYWKPSSDPIRNLVKAGALTAENIGHHYFRLAHYGPPETLVGRWAIMLKVVQ